MMKTLRYAFARTLPIMAGYLVLGLGFGVLLQSKGYGVGWSLAMSTLIYAGSRRRIAHLGGADDPDGQCPPPVLRCFDAAAL